MTILNTYAHLENAAKRGQLKASQALDLIALTIRDMFDHAEMTGLVVNGADPIERVAEAMAVCLVESDPALHQYGSR